MRQVLVWFFVGLLDRGRGSDNLQRKVEIRPPTLELDNHSLLFGPDSVMTWPHAG
jgi:hypothetical protein